MFTVLAADFDKTLGFSEKLVNPTKHHFLREVDYVKRTDLKIVMTAEALRILLELAGQNKVVKHCTRSSIQKVKVIIILPFSLKSRLYHTYELKSNPC